MKPLVIAVTESWSWKRRLTVFLSVFGAIWLLVQPIAVFPTGARVLSLLSWWGYFLLFVGAWIITVNVERRFRQRQLGSADFVAFYIVFVKSGRRIELHAPLDLEIATFLERFIEELKELFPINCSTMHLYTHNLLVERSGRFKPARRNLTLREAGITNGTICRLRGYIRVEYSNTTLTMGSRPGYDDFVKVRAEGSALLDEKGSMTYEE